MVSRRSPEPFEGGANRGSESRDHQEQKPHWLIESWQAIKQRPEVANNGFQKTGILQAVN